MPPIEPGSELLALQEALQGRFAIERELGRGGMGLVFLARDLSLDRPVAVKLLAPALAGRPEFRSRFLREARAAARLSHPHIVPVHSVEEHGEVVCFVMGFVDGESAGERVRRAGPMGPREALRLMREAAWALGHAHAVGLIHRDVKPDNILLERHSGRAVVTDFGIALGRDQRPGSGEHAGTPAYMSPEQANGEAVDARSDLYSLGVTMFHCVAGRLPLPGESVARIRADLPSSLAGAIDACRSPVPDDRPGSAEALLDRLAASVPAVAEAPAAVTAYVREASQVFGEVGIASLAAATTTIIYNLAFREDLFAALAFFPVIAVLAGLALTRFGELVLRTRALLAKGYSEEAVRPAIEAELRQQETASQEDRPAELMSRPWVIVSTGLAKTAAFVWLATLNVDTLTLIGLVGSVLMPAATARQLWRRSPGARGLWGRLMQGRLGRWLFRIARIANPAAPPAPDAPTAVFLGDAAERLHAALPPAERAALADLPEVVARLRADALGGTDSRAAAAVAALDALRLDLLRLQAGRIEADQLTRDLDAARRLGEAVDRAVQSD